MIQRFEQLPAWVVWVVCATLSTALTVFAYAGLVLPVQRHRAEASGLDVEVAEAKESVTALEARLARIDQRLVERRDRLAARPADLGDRRRLNRRIARVIGLARGLGLEVLQLQPGGETAGEYYHLVELRLNTAGGFAEHIELLGELHETFADMSVVGLELRSDPRRPDAPPESVLKLVWFTALPSDGGTVAGVEADRR